MTSAPSPQGATAHVSTLRRAIRSGTACLGGSFLGLAWLFPSTVASAIFGWLTAFAFVSCLLVSGGAHRYLYAAGVLSNAVAFHWLVYTIGEFGGFNITASLAIYVFFVAASSLQYIVVTLLYHFLPRRLDAFAMRAAVSWTTAEIVSIRIFPWHLGHTQINFRPFVQIADLGGAALISFMMIWLAEGLIRGAIRRTPVPVYPSIAFIVFLAYGSVTYLSFLKPRGDPQKVALVQANVSISEKHSVKYFSTNVERYLKLSQPFAHSSTLIVWPESVIQQPIPTNVGWTYNSPYLPSLNAPLLIGSLGWEPPRSFFNSAFAINPDQSVPPPYGKQILMPFGEYVPFSSIFPWLKEITGDMGEFTPGKDVSVFHYRVLPTDQLRVSPLICYEDVVPWVARRAVIAGATLLVNLTNDAWFGRSVAPFQHHLIASFRAIETRRYLLRATNTGLTAIVNPTGETIGQLPTFSEGTLLADVQLLSYKTLYAAVWGDGPWWLLSFIAMAVALTRAVKKRRDERAGPSSP